MTDDALKPEKSGNPRAAQTRIKGKNAGAVGGQRAHDLRIGPQPDYVDASRAHLNRVLIAPQTGTQLRTICEDRRKLRTTTRAMKSSAAVGVVGIITFGHEAQKIFDALTLEQQDAAYRETAEAIAERLNTTLTGLVAHGDESAAHAHFQLPAYDLTGHPVSETAKRAGVLTHPLLMSGLAYYDATSPIHRGVFLIRYVLGRTLRPPSEAFTPLSPDLHPDLTTRQRVALQTSPESCQVCHSKINALGFSLENYDAVGRFRTEERDRPIDPSGGYTTRQGERVDFQGAQELAAFLVESEDAHRAFVNRAFQFFVKQPPAAFGADTLDRLTAQFRENGYNIRDLLLEIAVIAAKRPLAADQVST